MKVRQVLIAAAVSAVALVAGTGCSVMRDQQSVGSYVDDTTVTTRVKAKFAEDPVVSAMAISVETLKGVVQLSGFAKSAQEKADAERLARAVSGVQSVKNDIVVRA
jgi:hyperosmotically inducible periplasmic protein